MKQLLKKKQQQLKKKEKQLNNNVDKICTKAELDKSSAFFICLNQDLG